MATPRSTQRRTAFGLLALYAAIGLGLYACKPEAAPAAEPLSVRDARTCAAVAAYAIATADDWSQRAAIAQASLNRYDELGTVPDCGPTLAGIVAAGLDPYLWQSSLDAVDAVRSGSYVLPPACVRAVSVTPLTDRGLPLPATAARAQCVIGDLVFVERGAL